MKCIIIEYCRFIVFIGLTLSFGHIQAGEIHNAVVAGDIETIKTLVENGTDINKKDRVLGTPLHYAASKGNLEVVRLLLESGAKKDIVTHVTPKKTALHLAAAGDNAGVVEYLLEQGMDVNSLHSLGASAMHEAASVNSVNVMKVLVKYGADMNVPEDVKKHTPLHVAVELGFIDATDYLLKNGANPNIGDFRGNTPLRWSMLVSSFNAVGGPQLIKLLLENDSSGLDDAIKWKQSFREHGDEKIIEFLDQLPR